MTTPIHWLHVSQRPAQGSKFLKRFATYNYQHTISNQGGFDTASCDIAVRSKSEGQSILNNYLGCFVQIYVDNPCQPIWEGLINRITFNSGGSSYTVSLDEMANRLNCIYTGATNVAAQTVVQNATGSQAIYGIKTAQFEFGADTSLGTGRSVLSQTMLAQKTWPQTSYGQSQGQSNLVHIEFIGIYHTLEWTNRFTGVTTGLSTFTALITGTVALDANGTTFYDNTDTSKIGSNTETYPQQQRGTSIWEIVQKIAECGDSSNYWICGITPTDFNTRKRVFYYQQANSAIEYTCRQSDGLKPRNLYGKPIAPWLIRPDRGIRVVDVISGFMPNQGYADPRETYIQSIQYDANTQKVQWFGADNTTAKAAFMLNRGYKFVSRYFGAPMRTIVT